VIVWSSYKVHSIRSLKIPMIIRTIQIYCVNRQTQTQRSVTVEIIVFVSNMDIFYC